MRGFLTRRQFLLRGAGITVGLAVALTGRHGRSSDVAAVDTSVVVYGLDALCGACRSCSACINHADNKLFANLTAAETGRAHPNCDCVVVSASALPYDTYVALFGDPEQPSLQSVDRRWDWVKDILG